MDGDVIRIDGCMRAQFPTLTDDQIRLVLTTDPPEHHDTSKAVAALPDTAAMILDVFGYDGLREWLRTMSGMDADLHPMDYTKILEGAERLRQRRFLESAQIIMTCIGGKKPQKTKLFKELQKLAGVSSPAKSVGTPMAGEE